MPSDKTKHNKRVVIEEVSTAPVAEPEEAPVDKIEEKEQEKGELQEVVKEKVSELQDITEHISGDIEKSSEVQEEIVKAADKVEPKIEDFAPPGSQVKNGPGPLIILIPGILLLGALLGGIYFYQKNVNSVSSESTPVPIATLEPSVTPSASPSAKLVLSKYPVKVQNGSGIPGVAGSAKSLLEKAGFTVSGTGNADNYEYTETVIKVKPDVPKEFITKLTTTLSGLYKVASETVALPASSKDEVIVIVGSSKSQ